LVIATNEVSLEAAHGLHAALALGFLAFEVCAGGRIESPARDCDHVQRSVDLAVAAAIQAVTIMSSGGDRYRRDACHPCEMGIALEALCARGLSDQDRGGQGTASRLGEQLGTMNADEVTQLALERLGLARQELYPKVVDAREEQGGVPSRLIKTDAGDGRQEGTPCQMFAGSPSGRGTRVASRSMISLARALAG